MSNTSTGRAVLVALVMCLSLSLGGTATSAAQSPASPSASPSTAAIAAPAGLPAGIAALISATLEAASAQAASAQAASAQAAVAAIEQPPVCRYRDKLTRYFKVKDWRKTLLDTNVKVQRSYAPWDLVPVRRAGLAGTGSVRRVIIDDLRAMATAARKAGKPLAVRSAYRSYATQVATFNSWVSRSGYQQALKFSARPGHSEHQLGTTIDFTVAPGQPLSSRFGRTPQGQWLKRHAWRYGFVLSYPKGQEKLSCYGFEPWHWRYVGRKLARQIHDSGLVPRVYLWNHFEAAP